MSRHWPGKEERAGLRELGGSLREAGVGCGIRAAWCRRAEARYAEEESREKVGPDLRTTPLNTWVCPYLSPLIIPDTTLQGSRE